MFAKFPRDPLLAAGWILAALGQLLMIFAAAALLIGAPVLAIYRSDITAELRTETGDATAIFPIWEVTGVMLLAAIAVVLIFLFLRHMRHIIETVGFGDPFVPENAGRLTTMAWLMLALQVLSLPLLGLILLVAKAFEDSDVTIDGGLDLNGIVLVVILFILARIFRKGTQMRADLEGTV